MKVVIGFYLSVLAIGLIFTLIFGDDWKERLLYSITLAVLLAMLVVGAYLLGGE